MEFIEEVLSMSVKNDKKDIFVALLAVLFAFLGITVISIVFNGSSLFGIFFFLTAFISPVIGFLLGMKIKNIFKRKIVFESTKLYKKIQKSGYLNEFMNTINDEIILENTIKYVCDIQGIGLLITKTWFVFIDTKHPVIVKTSEIVKISEELSSSNSRFFYV